MMIESLQPKSWRDNPDPSQFRLNRLDDIDAAIESGRLAGISEQDSLCPYPHGSDLEWYWKMSFELASKTALA